jgi:alpha-ribazole phosphatase
VTHRERDGGAVAMDGVEPTEAAPTEGSRLWVARHPAVAPFAGAVGDLELPQLHPADVVAAQVVSRLAALPLVAIVSSPRLRCSQVAERLGSLLALPLRIEPRLREIEHGEWTGRSWEEIEARDGERYRRWLAHWIDTAPPGGESAQELVARVASALAVAEPETLWITHRGVLQALRVLAGQPWLTAAEVPVLTLEQPASVRALTRRADGSLGWGEAR